MWGEIKIKKIDFVLAVRNRENERIQRCINSFKEIANKIFVVDYNSDKPIKLKDCEIIRTTESKIWNKSHALNLGIKKSKADYICTIDCDMILTEKILNEILNKVNKKAVIFNTNVRRIELEDINNNFSEMLTKSQPWFEEGSRGNIYSAANGGIQIFPREWINLIGGYDEGLGLYWGAMDNRIYEQAKGLGMSIIDLNLPMFHQEHKNLKEANLPQDEKKFASYVRAYKIQYLNELIKEKSWISKRAWGEEKPNHDWMIERVNLWKKALISDKNLENKYYKVYVGIITNFPYVPTYFAKNLIQIVGHAKDNGIEVLINNPKRPAVDSIRNACVIDAMNHRCTHILQLDDDHIYPEDLITRLLEHKKEMVLGVTNKSVPPFTQTQYKKCDLEKINIENNICKFKDEEGLEKIEASGMVGSLIKLNVFNRMEYPYYAREYKIVNNKALETGEDIYFSRKLKKLGIDIWCDKTLNYPHQIKQAFCSRGDVTIQPI